MPAVLKFAGYHKETERPAIEHPVPAAQSAKIRALACLVERDDGIGCHPLDARAASRIGLAISQPLDSRVCDWFLEPASTNG